MFSSFLINSSGMTLAERLHETILPTKYPLFGGINVSASFYSALIVTAILIVIALIIRIFVIPKFNDDKPSGLQLFIEGLVNFFDNMTTESVMKYQKFVGPYIFTAAIYICFGTLIELFGLRPVLADINSCISLAIMSCLQIYGYSFVNKSFLGASVSILKDITLPISFSFRLFGSILSGLLIMELIYSFLALSFVIPAAASVMFTLFHAFIQSYVFAQLSALFIGESTEMGKKKELKHKKREEKRAALAK